MIRIILLCVLLSGCMTSQEVVLRWKVDSAEPHVYATIIEDRNPRQNTELLLANGFDVLADPVLRQQVKTSLVNYKLPLATYVTSLTPINGHIRAITRGIKPEYLAPPKDETEEWERQSVSEKVDRYILIGDVLPSGELLSYYLHRPQKNLMSIFFRLPDRKIREGDSWSVPTHLISTGTRFFPSKLDRVNEVVVDEIVTLENGQSIAKLFYVISETVAGEYDFGPENEKVVLDMTASFLGYAEFNIDKGQWVRMAGIVFREDREAPVRTSLQLLALRPLPK